MKKFGGVILLVVALLGFSDKGKAQTGGIRFEQGNWAEIREKARQEKKLIFADFYTEWCGPCLVMAEEVFPLMEVGNFYNYRFVNVKIDAEKGEGKMLREKYKVISYPTFLFIDPQSEAVVHRSSSRQDAETFLFTGHSAVTPVRRSPYLEKEYELGNRSRELLKDYMDYLASVYRRDKLAEVTEIYLALPDFSLRHAPDWEVFVKYVGGAGHPHFQEVLKNREEYAGLYGQVEVDKKLFREFNLSLDTEALEKAPDFKGKAFLLRKNRAEQKLRTKAYKEAIPLLDTLMAEPGDFREELCRYLKFTARSALYGEHPEFWIKKCAELAQYVAYNSSGRQDAGIHYDYAVLLERLIRHSPGAGSYFPASIVEGPQKGIKEYSLRSPKLKQKPKKSRTK